VGVRGWRGEPNKGSWGGRGVSEGSKKAEKGVEVGEGRVWEVVKPGKDRHTGVATAENFGGDENPPKRRVEGGQEEVSAVKEKKGLPSLVLICLN